MLDAPRWRPSSARGFLAGTEASASATASVVAGSAVAAAVDLRVLRLRGVAVSAGASSAVAVAAGLRVVRRRVVVAASAVTGAAAPSNDCLGRDRLGLAGRWRLLAELGPQHLLELGRDLAPLGTGSRRRSPGRRSVVTSATLLATRRGP